MKIEIITPTKAIIAEYQPDALDSLKKKLTYTNKSIQFQISSWNRNIRMKKFRPAFWNERMDELKSQLKECILKMDKEGNYYIRPGLIDHLNLRQNVVTNKIYYPQLKEYSFKEPLPFTLYDYQNTSVNNLINEKHGCVSLATGCGKSLILLSLTQRMGLKTVVIVPSKQIFTEIVELFTHHLGKDLVGTYGDGKKDIKKPVTIAISKSLTMLEKGTEEYTFFEEKELLITDESHLFAAETLDKTCHGVLHRVPYRFFLSGTNVRNDGKDIVLQSIIGKEVCSLDTKTAIEKGYLCPLNFTIIKTTSPTKKPEQKDEGYKDPIVEKRKHFLYNSNIADLIAKICNASATVLNESTLVLVEELTQIADLVARLKVPYAYCHSAAKKDAQEWGLEVVNTKDSIAKFNNGEVKVLIGTSCIDTGTNMYPTHNTCNWVGGSSEVTTKQGTIGRSVRKLENSKFKNLHKPKPYTKIFDFDVTNSKLLHSQLEKRVEWYEDTGCPLKYKD
jgi:superfamily II DNA or RNA helicase